MAFKEDVQFNRIAMEGKSKVGEEREIFYFALVAEET